MKLVSFRKYLFISGQFQFKISPFFALKWVSLKKNVLSCAVLRCHLHRRCLTAFIHNLNFSTPRWTPKVAILLQLWWASYCISSKWSGFEDCAFYRYLPLSVWGMSKRSLNLSVVGALCKAADIPSPSAQWTYWMEHHLLKAEVTSSHVFTLHFALAFLPFAGRSRRTDSPSPHL